MKNILSLVVTVLALVTAGAQAAGDVEAGRAKSTTCAGCHGPAGVSANPVWPNLAGQVPGYIARQLADFKSGARQNPLMAGQAAPLSAQDMADLDAYFSSLEATVTGTTHEELAKLGEKIYRGGNFKTGVSACMSCHGPSGHGLPPKFPRVSGQNAEYTKAQLKAFKDGLRTNDGEIMTRIAFRMSLQEIDAVSEYMAHLKSANE